VGCTATKSGRSLLGAGGLERAPSPASSSLFLCMQAGGGARYTYYKVLEVHCTWNSTLLDSVPLGLVTLTVPGASRTVALISDKCPEPASPRDRRNWNRAVRKPKLR
jgi:hypothetical protein